MIEPCHCFFALGLCELAAVFCCLNVNVFGWPRLATILYSRREWIGFIDTVETPDHRVLMSLASKFSLEILSRFDVSAGGLQTSRDAIVGCL